MFTGLVQRVGTVKRVSRGAGLVLESGGDRPRKIRGGPYVILGTKCAIDAGAGDRV